MFQLYYGMSALEGYICYVAFLIYKPFFVLTEFLALLEAQRTTDIKLPLVINIL